MNEQPVYMYVYCIYDSFSNMPGEVFASAIEPEKIGTILERQNLNQPRPNCMTEDIRLLLQVDVKRIDCMSQFPVVGDFKKSLAKLEERRKEYARDHKGNREEGN